MDIQILPLAQKVGVIAIIQSEISCGSDGMIESSVYNLPEQDQILSAGNYYVNRIEWHENIVNLKIAQRGTSLFKCGPLNNVLFLHGRVLCQC